MSHHIARWAVVWGIVSLLGMLSGIPQAAAQFPCPFNPPTLTSEVPSDTPVNDQAALNCFAWQEFIALNWLAAPEGGGRIGPE